MVLRTAILALCCVCASQAQTDLSSRIAQAEQTLERFYRGESMNALRDRSNREIEAYNARTKAVNAELEKAKARLEEVQKPAQEAYARLQELEAGLQPIPDGNDEAGNRRYEEKVAVRNAAARRVNELNAQAKAAIDAYNAKVAQENGGLNQERQRVMEAQKALDGRITAYNAFVKGGQDVAYFIGVNRLLAEIRQGLRAVPSDPGLQKALARVRAVRRELAAWAKAEQERLPNGLVVVEARVQDEPVWLFVDSGAMSVVLGLELVEASGLRGALGAEDGLVVVGGQRILGRGFEIPRLSVGDQALTQVKAYAVRPGDVGVDGLLGQSFLKSFIVTLDPDAPEKVVFKKREGLR